MTLIANKTMSGSLGIVKKKGAPDRLSATIEDMKIATNVSVSVLKGQEVDPKAYPPVIMEHLKDRGVLGDPTKAKVDTTTAADVMGADERPGEVTVAPSKGATDALSNEFDT